MTRQAEVRQDRRRRDDTTLDGGQRLNLAIPPEIQEKLKAEGRVPRWVNDDGNRMYNLTQRDDYDPVAGVEPVLVGTTKDGKPMKAILCSKPAAFLHEDQEKKDAARRETERALVSGNIPGANPLPSDVSYADKANKIDTGYRPK